MLYGSGKYTYELVDHWAKLPEGWSFPDVDSVFTVSQDRVYLLTGGAHPVVVFDRSGDLITSWGEGLFKKPHRIFVGPDGFVYCTDRGNHTVSKYTAEGRLILTLGNKGQPSDTGYVHRPKATMTERMATIQRSGPPFNVPTGVALSSQGDIFVSDGYGNARVHKFASDGTLLFSWGEPGTAPGQFKLPHSIWVDKQDRVWVADRENDRIQIFNAQGEFLSQWTGITKPGDIFIDHEERVYVTELVGRVSIFSIDGRLLACWGDGQDKETGLLYRPHTIAVDSHGDIYVGEVGMSHAGIDRGARTLQKYVRKS